MSTGKIRILDGLVSTHLGQKESKLFLIYEVKKFFTKIFTRLRSSDPGNVASATTSGRSTSRIRGNPENFSSGWKTIFWRRSSGRPSTRRRRTRRRRQRRRRFCERVDKQPKFGHLVTPETRRNASRRYRRMRRRQKSFKSTKMIKVFVTILKLKKVIFWKKKIFFERILKERKVTLKT